jgi:transglutaminase-like putative cysteine protease
VPPDPAPIDFNAWFGAYIGGQWYTFHAGHKARRIGRILIARGREAADIPMIASFGPHDLTQFEIITEEIPEDDPPDLHPYPCCPTPLLRLNMASGR